MACELLKDCRLSWTPGFGMNSRWRDRYLVLSSIVKKTVGPGDVPANGSDASFRPADVPANESGASFRPWLCMTITVYSLNMFGDALRDLLDPRLRGSQGSYGTATRKRKRGLLARLLSPFRRRLSLRPARFSVYASFILFGYPVPLLVDCRSSRLPMSFEYLGDTHKFSR